MPFALGHVCWHWSGWGDAGSHAWRCGRDVSISALVPINLKIVLAMGERLATMPQMLATQAPFRLCAPSIDTHLFARLRQTLQHSQYLPTVYPEQAPRPHCSSAHQETYDRDRSTSRMAVVHILHA